MRNITLTVAGVTLEIEDDGEAPTPIYNFELSQPVRSVEPDLSGAIVDNAAGLMWSADDVLPKKCTHAEAEEACKALRLGGFDDWRLPTVKELFGLVDHSRHSPAIDVKLFPTCKKDWYWTSTTYAASPDYAWIVLFSYGNASYGYRVYDYGFVRAVRSVAPGQ